MSHTMKMVAAFGLLALTAAGASSQNVRQRTLRVPTSVVLVDALPVDAAGSYLVERRPNEIPADVIFLKAGSTAADLSEAIRGLQTAREINGDYPAKAVTLRVRPRSQSAARKEIKWAEKVLRDLEKAPRKDIKSAAKDRVTKGREVVIYLPGRAANSGGLRSSSP